VLIRASIAGCIDIRPMHALKITSVGAHEALTVGSAPT